MMKVFGFLSAFLLILNTIWAQSENPLLSRDYWKAQPSIEKVRADIEKGNSPSELDRYDFDAIAWAILENTNDEIIKYLLEQDGNDVNKLTHDGRTYIFWAAYKNRLELMKYLKANGARTDIIDSHGYSLVNFCAVTGQMNFDIYDFCIEYGSILTEEFNSNGANPLLLLSSFFENEQQLSYFTGKGLDLNSQDEDGNNAFVYAAKSGNMFMMNLLLDKHMDPHVNNDAALFFAARGMRRKPNKLPVYEFLQSLGCDYKVLNEDNQNLLHILSKTSKDTTLLHHLISNGVSLDQRDNEGLTPVSVAVDRNNFPALILYNKSKPNFEVVDQKGNNLIHKAVKHENAQLLDFILSHGVDINAKNNDGLTPLHMVAMSGESINFLEKMLDKGANVKFKTEFGESAYDLAIENELMNSNLKHLKILVP